MKRFTGLVESPHTVWIRGHKVIRPYWIGMSSQTPHILIPQIQLAWFGLRFDGGCHGSLLWITSPHSPWPASKAWITTAYTWNIQKWEPCLTKFDPESHVQESPKDWEVAGTFCQLIRRLLHGLSCKDPTAVPIWQKYRTNVDKYMHAYMHHITSYHITAQYDPIHYKAIQDKTIQYNRCIYIYTCIIIYT